ncbi:MAG: phosphoribosylformylglycinamidine synthase subunit PurS [Caldisericia bacterium]|nr:phosphoribosylformylglycinamidine synthase subunit PurS [Caldisericia bacterium]
MNHRIEVTVQLKPDILDPQGKTVGNALGRLGFTGISNVRIGKSIIVEIDAPTQGEALAKGTEMASKLLANPVMEVFTVKPA